MSMSRDQRDRAVDRTIAIEAELDALPYSKLSIAERAQRLRELSAELKLLNDALRPPSSPGESAE
jgi:hypothetical protein